MHTPIIDDIVLVASTARRPHDGYKTLMSGHDMPKAISNRILLYSLRKLCGTVHYYTSIESFVDNINAHKDHIIFPYYYAVGSRINHSYVQSICESNGIKFIGPESYALTVCNDKVLSKDICRAKSISTPNCAVIYTETDEPVLDFLRVPIIVKPVFEGNSIGISRDSICNSYAEARDRAKWLYSKILAPIMLEEYIEGTEINICMIGNSKNPPQINTVALDRKGALYDYRQKHSRLSLSRYKPYGGDEIEQEKKKFYDIFSMLGKVEFMRIDCILGNEGISCIELTPDADLSINSALYKSISSEMSYIEFLNFLIQNSIESYKNL